MDDPVNNSALQYADPPVAWSVPGDPAAWIVAADKPVRVSGGAAVVAVDDTRRHSDIPLDRVIGDLAADRIVRGDGAERIRTLEAENAALRRQLRGNPEPAVGWCEYEPLSVSGGVSCT